jgi:hypothetical protein
MADKTFAELNDLAKLLRNSPEKADRAFVSALDFGANKARDLGVDQIFRELNLDRAYITKHLVVNQKAKLGDLTSKIGATRRQVLLTRYGGDKIKTTAAKSPRRKLKGDKSRRIRSGQKADGIKAFSVKRGGKKTAWDGGFLIKLSNGNGWGLAVRTGSARNAYRVKSGPSVADAWKSVRRDIEPEVYEEISKRFRKDFKRFF